MIFVIDVDDTICDSDGFSEYYIERFFSEHNLPYKLVNKVSRFAEGKFDWDMQTANAWYKKYGDEMMLNFPPKPNAIETMNYLYDAGHTIIYATARANDWHTDPEAITKNWFQKHKIKYSKLYIGVKDKTQICKDFDADFFVDDDIKLCEEVSKFSGKTTAILMQTEYNNLQPKPENIKTISSLSELINIIKNAK